MSNHHTIALVGLAVVAWVLLLDPSLLKRWRLILLSLACFFLGLLPYAYLPLRASANPPMNWGDPSTLQRFWEHVTRHQYGAIGPIKTPEPRSWTRLVAQIEYAAEALIDDMTWPLVILAGLGLVLLARGRRAVFLLSMLWLTCTGLLFVVLANFDLDRTSRWTMRVFFIPTWLGLIIPIAYLLDQSIRHAITRLEALPRLRIAAVAGAAIAGPAVLLISHWKHCDYSDYCFGADHANAMLACMDKNAMVFPSGDHSTFPLTYCLLVENKRPDVLIADIYGYIRPDLLYGYDQESPISPESWLIEHENRPTYYAVKKRTDVAPAGVLHKLLADKSMPDHEKLLANCTYRNEVTPTFRDFGAEHILADVEFFRGLAALDGDSRSDALDHFGESAKHGQGIREVFNNLGSALAEHGLTAEAEIRYLEAATLDWHYTLSRWNLFRLYSRQGRWSDARSQLVEIIRADPQDAGANAELGFLLNGRFGETARAMDYWHEALRIDPRQARVIHALDRIYGGGNPN